MIRNFLSMIRRSLNGPTQHKSAASRKGRSAPPTLELLENRLAPATLVAASYFDSAVYSFDSSTGALLQTLVAPNSQATLQGPAGMTVGPDGNLYLSSQFNESIVKLDVATGTLSTFIGGAVLNPIAQGNGLAAFMPAGLAFGPDGDLYVSLNGGQQATSGGAVIRFDIENTGGTLSYAGTNVAVATGLIQPTDVAFGGTSTTYNTLFVSNSAMAQVVKIAQADSASPTMTTFIQGPIVNGVPNFYPTGLFTGPGGNLAVVDLAATDSHSG